MIDISTRIRKLRKDKNFRQQQIADYLGISQQSYSHYEQHKRELPIRHVIKLAEFYNISTDYLLGTSPCRTGEFDFNSYYIQDIPLRNILLVLHKLNRKNRLELVRFLSFLDHSNEP